jgi:hypothetical protein
MTEKYTQFSGVFIPREVLLDQDVPANAKLIFAIVQSLDNDKGCYASNDYLGGMLGLSESAVRASLHILEGKGYITRTIEDGIKRTLKTCVTQSFRAQPRQISEPTPPEIEHTPRQKSGTYVSKKNRIVDTKALDLPPLPHGEKFYAVWDEWVNFRKEVKKPLTPTSIREQLKFLTELTEDDAITSIKNSIRSGWVGLFPVKQSTNKFSSKLLTNKDHEQF